MISHEAWLRAEIARLQPALRDARDLGAYTAALSLAQRLDVLWIELGRLLKVDNLTPLT